VYLEFTTVSEWPYTKPSERLLEGAIENLFVPVGAAAGEARLCDFKATCKADNNVRRY